MSVDQTRFLSFFAVIIEVQFSCGLRLSSDEDCTGVQYSTVLDRCR